MADNTPTLEEEKNLRESQPPSLGISGEDSRDMSRAMRGVTTSRATGMAHQTAEKAMSDYAVARNARK